MAVDERGGRCVTRSGRIPSLRLGRGYPGAVCGHRDQAVSPERHDNRARPSVAQLRGGLSHSVQAAAPQLRAADG
jgi:hypothetical protein